MAQPRLTFACELDPDRLTGIFANAPSSRICKRSTPRVALMLSDFSEARAAVVQRLKLPEFPSSPFR